MDYIREELLRQRRAWSALLRSGQQTEKEEQPAPAGAGAEQLLPMEAAESGRRTAEFALAEPAPTAVPSRGARQKTAPRRSRVSAADAAVEVTGRGAGGGAAGVPVYPAMQALRPESRGEAGVKELSRIIQRDSRRYDGGFTLY